MHHVVEGLLREALTFPGAWEDHPWGDTVVKVRKKIFVFVGQDGFAVKLPESAEIALGLPGSQPSGYGLGKAGWVNVKCIEDDLPVDLFSDFLDESYRAIAPKKLIKELDAARGSGA